MLITVNHLIDYYKCLKLAEATIKFNIPLSVDGSTTLKYQITKQTKLNNISFNPLTPLITNLCSERCTREAGLIKKRIALKNRI